MPTPSSYPPEPSLDAIEGRATFDGHVVRLERWGREADRRRCAYAAAPIGSVRGVQVMTTPDATFLVIDVVAPNGEATGVPVRPGALARSVWTLRVLDPAKAARFADVVKRTVVRERVRTVTSCPTPAPPTAQEQAPAATTEPETDAAPQSQPAQSDDGQSQSQSTDADSGTHDDGRNQTQEGESDVSGAEGSQAGQ